jgi:WD40 repeat protein
MRSALLVGCLLMVFMAAPISAQEDRELPSLEVITVENARQLQEIGTLGRGVATALDWHPNGEVLAVGSPTGLWLLDETLQGIEHTPIQQEITDLAWSPDGTRIAVVSYLRDRCTVQVWDADFTVSELIVDYCGAEIQWNADSRYIAIFNLNPTNNEVLLIDVIEDKVMTLPGQDGVWSPSGNILFTRLRYAWTYTDTPTLYTWDVKTKESLSVLDITENQSGSILWGVDDWMLAIECSETEADSDSISVGLCSFDARTGEITPIREVATYAAGQSILSLMGAAWNVDETLLAFVPERHTRGFLNDVFVLDTRTKALTNIGNGMVFDWKPGANEITVIVGNGEIRTYSANAHSVLAESQWFTAPINMIALRPGSYEIASTGFGYEQDTKVWDVGYSWTDPLLTFYAEPAELVDYTPDGSELIAGGIIITDIVANQSIDAFDPDTGDRIRNIAGFYDQGSSPLTQYWNWNADYTETLSLPDNIEAEAGRFPAYISWSPDYSKVAIVEQSIQDYYDSYIRTWDAETGEFINQFRGGMFGFTGLVWSPDSTRIAALLQRSTGSGNEDRGLRVFSVVSGQNYEFDQSDYQVLGWINWINREESTQQAKAAWNSDGTLIAVSLPDGLEIHDLSGAGTPLASLPAYEIVDLEWSDDGRFIATGGEDGIVRIWGIPSP